VKELLYLNSFLYRYKWRLILGSIFVVAQNYFRLLVPPQFRKALDLAGTCLKEYRAEMDPVEKEVIINYIGYNLRDYAFWVIGFAIIMGIFMYLMRKTIIVVSRLIEYDLRKVIFQHYQELDSSFYKRNSTGDMMSRITEDLSKVRMYLGPGLLYCVNLVTLFVLAIYYMYNVNATLTFYALLPLPFLSLSIYLVSSIINSKSEVIQRQLAKLTTIAQEVYSGIRVIKSYTKEEQFITFFNSQSEEYKNHSMALQKVNALFFPLMLLLVSSSILLVMIIGGQEVAKGTITHGNIAEFIIYVNMLTWPFTAVGWIVSIVQQAEASQQRINEFLKTESEITSPTTAPLEVHGKIEFKNVNFTYIDSGTQALRNVTFTVNKGEKLGVIGKTASGKSSIANLLLRMSDIQSGEILIDGINIKELNLFALRQQIGYVPQDAFLFSDTISKNIAFGRQDATDDEISAITRSAAVYDDVMDLPEQFNTKIGERGVTLSGGQKQRVSLARALIKLPEIIILDDCLSAVDTTTEQTILGYLNEALSNKTSIIITHRIYKHLNFDRVIVLDDGEIIEQGTPEELVEKQGYYYEILNKQLVEENSSEV
jgi:ATP-binding cassette, subfamily B, multidrug efflux pump